MKAFVKFHAIDVLFPPSSPPSWATKVSRWNQLDEAAFGVLEVFTSLKPPPSPLFLWVASPGGSSVTDGDFIALEYQSAQKFTHTLPNVRVAPLLEYLDTDLGTICLEKAPLSVAQALVEAYYYLKVGTEAGSQAEVCVCGVLPPPDFGSKTRAYWITVSLKPHAGSQVLLEESQAGQAFKSDVELISFFERGIKGANKALSSGVVLSSVETD